MSKHSKHASCRTAPPLRTERQDSAKIVSLAPHNTAQLTSLRITSPRPNRIVVDPCLARAGTGGAESRPRPTKAHASDEVRIRQEAQGQTGRGGRRRAQRCRGGPPGSERTVPVGSNRYGGVGQKRGAVQSGDLGATGRQNRPGGGQFRDEVSSNFFLGTAQPPRCECHKLRHRYPASAATASLHLAVVSPSLRRHLAVTTVATITAAVAADATGIAATILITIGTAGHRAD